STWKPLRSMSVTVSRKSQISTAMICLLTSIASSRSARLAGACPLLVHGARGDLLCPPRGPALALLALLDVLVLTSALGSFFDSSRWHLSASFVVADRRSPTR